MERRTERSNAAQTPAGVRSGTVVDARMTLAIWLRTGRAQRGMRLEDVSKITKIQPRILERLEAGKLDGLPADVFVRGFIRSFAKCVGLDEDEALRRYAQCGSGAQLAPAAGTPSASARAFVDSMSDLAPSAARGTPRVLDAEPDAPETHDTHVVIFAAGSAKDLQQATSAVETFMLPETGTLIVEAAIESPAIGSPVDASDATDPRDGIDLGPSAAAEIVVAQGTVVEAAAPVTREPTDSKKKRKRGKGRGKRAGASGSMATGTPSSPSPIVVAAPTTNVVAREAAVTAVTAVDASEAVVADVPSASGPAIEAVEAVEVVEMSEPWAPKMPAVVSTNMSWRRPFASSTPAASLRPSLVIDDADPDSAERELEERAASNDVSPRRSFLPPILLDREDRSARQGGLTLAVIILLIAATLTLSYLMRRPSSSGDGVTRAETALQQLA
jgi:hypothetical protein